MKEIIKMLLSEIKIIAIPSIIIPLVVTLLTIGIKKQLGKRDLKKLLKINFKILTRDIQELLSYLEGIIIERDVVGEYILQELDYNQILIDYNNFYGNEEEIINNLLEFYNIRTKIKKYPIEKIKIFGHLDRQLNFKKKTDWHKLDYIRFVEEIYKQLEVVFIKHNLENQLKEWEKTFMFKSLEEIRENRKQILLTKKNELEDYLNRIIYEHNINIVFEKDTEDLDSEEKEFLNKYHEVESEYYSLKATEDYYAENKYSSIKDVYADIIYTAKEIYDIKVIID